MSLNQEWTVDKSIPSTPHLRKVRGMWMIAKQTDAGLVFLNLYTGWMANYITGSPFPDESTAAAHLLDAVTEETD